MMEDQNFVQLKRKRDRGYTVLNNAIFMQNKLSAKAVGLFCYLMSLPPDWKLYISELPNHFADGHTSIRSGLKELEAEGFLITERLRQENGNWGNMLYTLDDDPYSDFTSVDERDLSNRDPVEADTTKSDTTDSGLLSTNEQITNNKPNTKSNRAKPSTPKNSSKLFSESKTSRKSSSKKERFVEEHEKLLKEYDFSENVEDDILDFFSMLADLGTFLPEITLRLQLNQLAELTPPQQANAVKTTITRGWRSLDYAVKDVIKQSTPSFDTSKPGSFQPKDPNNDQRYKDYEGDEVF